MNKIELKKKLDQYANHPEERDNLINFFWDYFEKLSNSKNILIEFLYEKLEEAIRWDERER